MLWIRPGSAAQAAGRICSLSAQIVFCGRGEVWDLKPEMLVTRFGVDGIGLLGSSETERPIMPWKEAKSLPVVSDSIEFWEPFNDGTAGTDNGWVGGSPKESTDPQAVAVGPGNPE